MNNLFDMKKACSECELIIGFFDDSLKKKIPQSFLDYLAENKEEGYVPELDFNLPIESQKLRTETYALLTIIYTKYFCETEAEKCKILDIIKNKK